jgi:acyl-CoA thioester hydrolase
LQTCRYGSFLQCDIISLLHIDRNDNDQYGHLNNVISYEYFDTIVNKYLIDECGLGSTLPVVGYVVYSSCSFFGQMKYPDVITAGLSVDSIGASSVTYRIGLFPPGAEGAASAGHFRHAYVHSASRLPVKPLPDDFLAKLQTLLVPTTTSKL